ncbi:MAG: DUF4369 domain-containing protein, partial [Muribaculaceae bacterium]|nr:DUF4369 domain-containing protein [Muribaculaceae bacterium]
MKRISIIALTGLALMNSCNSRPANQFDLAGEIEGADGQIIYMTYVIDDSLVRDSALIADGRFAFKGTIESPVNSMVYIGDPRYNAKLMTQVYLEPAEMTVSQLKADDFTSAIVTWSKTQ